MYIKGKLYDALKWFALAALPTLAWGYEALAGKWGWPFVEQVPFTLNVAGTVIAILIGVSSAGYYKAKGVQDVAPRVGGTDE